MPLTSEAARPVVAGYEQRMQMTTALNHLIKRYRDGIMIANLGPADGAVDRIELLGIRAEESRRLAVIV